MEFQASASLGATALVSYDTVAVREDLRRGEIVLMHAAAGGLGLMSVQIAKAFEARVIATAPIKEKLEVARKFGAYECLDNSGGQEWWKTILEQTGGKGVDLVFDSACILAVRFAGREGNLEKVAMNKVPLKQAKIIGYRFGETDGLNPEATLQVWNGLNEMLKTGLVKPIVFGHKYNGLESVVKALEDLSARKVWGKEVVMVEGVEEGAKL